jgi:transposase
MSLATAAPPDDPEALRAFTLELQAALGRSEARLEAAEAELKARRLRIQKLEHQLAVLKRARFGRSSEKLDQEIEQLELAIGDLQETSAETEAREEAAGESAPQRKARGPKKPLPSHLPREIVRHEPPTACPACGSQKLSVIGEDSREVLEYVPAHFKVVVHVRPKVSCRACEAIAQAPAAPVPIERALPGPRLLAHIAVSKFCDHLPLYRQSEIYGRQEVDLDRATMAEWLGRLAFLLGPLAERVGEHVRAGESLHADDTTVPVLDPGRGRTKTGRLWALVRDERPFGSRAPPAVLYRYSPDRKGEHARALLEGCEGFLHADGYAGFEKLFAPVPPANAPRLFEVACWAHARRKLYDVKEGSPAAEEALRRISLLFAIEEEIAGLEPEARLAVRRRETVARLAELRTFLDATLRRISRKGKLAGAIRYATARWDELTRFTTDGRLEMTNNAAERAMRIPVLGRKNYLFAGSDEGGVRAAIFYTLIGTARLGDIDPEAWLADVASRIADHPVSRLGELLPWNWRADPARDAA